jgi:hypothetical protein
MLLGLAHMDSLWPMRLEHWHATMSALSPLAMAATEQWQPTRGCLFEALCDRFDHAGRIMFLILVEDSHMEADIDAPDRDDFEPGALVLAPGSNIGQ